MPSTAATRAGLRVVAAIFEPTTKALLRRVGVAVDARCLDVGCGGGDVTRMLAAMAPRGEVIGTDADPVKIALARSEAAGYDNVGFRVEDIAVIAGGPAQYDVVYARFLLSHLADPLAAVASLVGLLDHGGALVVEDIEIAGVFEHPPSAAFQRGNELYSATVRSLGADPDIGPRLPALLQQAGLADIDAAVRQPSGLHGAVKQIHALTLQAIAANAVAAGLTTMDEVESVAVELGQYLDRADTFVTTPRIVQAWGYRRV